MAATRRWEALRTPHVSPALASSLVARLPNAMITLALLLLIGPVHGYALAGLGCTILLIAMAVSNPLLARLVDRLGAVPVIVPTTLGNAVGLAALAVVPSRMLWAEYVAVVVAGLTAPPVTAVVRGLWPRLVSEQQLPVMFGIEATAQELTYIVGPALLALIAGGLGAHAAVGATAGLALAGGLTFAISAGKAHSAGTSPAEFAAAGRRPRLLSLRLLSWLVLAASLTAGFGATEVGIVAFVSPGHGGSSSVSGAVFVAWSAGSMIGGLVFGSKERMVTDRSVVVNALLIALTLVLPALAVGDWMLGALVFASGCFVAPGLGRLYTRISGAATPERQTEAFGWLAVAFIVGQSVGAAIGGAAADRLGARAALAVAGALPLLGSITAVALLRRSAERSSEAPRQLTSLP